MLAGDIFELKYTYDDSFETSIYTITVPNCQLLNVVASGGETNEGSTTVIKFNAAGGTDTWTLTQTSRVNAN